MTHNRETARADARTPEGLWICRICRGLWTAVDEYAHTRPQPPWETSPVTHRVTPDVSHSSLGIPVRNHRDSHSYTAPTTVGWSTLLSQAGRTTETNEAGHLNTRKSPRVASLRTLSTFARNHCPPSSEYAVQIARTSSISERARSSQYSTVASTRIQSVLTRCRRG